jgi:TPR repeat protein
LERLRNPPAVYIPENQTEAVSNLAKSDLQVNYTSDTELKGDTDLRRPIIKTTNKDVTEEDKIGFDAVDAAMLVLTLDKDRGKAKTLLEKPALNGNPIACRHLGLIFYKENEYKTAKKWFEKAAIKKDPESYRYLGILYFLGQGVKQDYPTADLWLTKAAQSGDLEASRYLRVVKQFY